ncbi:MAG: hypothetical protein V7L30_22645 [Nostoc sp.]|uniref:hypothetical protein n=1 Tax=Nostoc sp. TaxID=1180 RepID=UPI002FF60609
MTKDMNQSITGNVIHASEICGKQLSDFIEYVLDVDPELKSPEAIMVVASILNQLPSAFANNPDMLSDLQKTCKTVKQRRK